MEESCRVVPCRVPWQQDGGEGQEIRTRTLVLFSYDSSFSVLTTHSVALEGATKNGLERGEAEKASALSTSPLQNSFVCMFVSVFFVLFLQPRNFILSCFPFVQ